MKNFRKFSADEQNDFNLFNETNFDLTVVNNYLKSKLDGTRSSGSTEYHNNLVYVRTIVDKFIDVISFYENEVEDSASEDA